MKKRLSQIQTNLKELANPNGAFTEGGLEILIPEAVGNPQCPDDGPIWIEFYEGKLLVHIWNGDQNPETVELKLK